MFVWDGDRLQIHMFCALWLGGTPAASCVDMRESVIKTADKMDHKSPQ